MKKILCLTITALLSASVCAYADGSAKRSPDHTVAFVQRDSCTLYMDIYESRIPNSDKPAVIFMFGGGFKSGSRISSQIRSWADSLNGRGYTLVSIDYRLGLKSVKNGGVNAKFIKNLKNAIDIAVEDLFSATLFLVENGSQYGIDPHRLVISGSSAGAISVLQAEYEICNRGALASVLPEDFNYQGVMAFSGAILDMHHNPLRFSSEPCPLALFHGKCDKLVPYKKTALFNMCFGGSDAISKCLKKAGFTHHIYRYEDRAHDVCVYMEHCMKEELLFLDEIRCAEKVPGKWVDTDVNDPTAPRLPWGKSKPSTFY